MKVKCDNKYCDVIFNKKVSDIKRTKHNFCSRSCATSYNNIKKPKRKLEGNCYKCGHIISKTRKFCNNCKRKSSEELDEMELKDVIYYNHHKSSAFALVRSRARRKGKKLGMTSCVICGYNKHVEIGHKIGISKFSLNTKIKIINDEKKFNTILP